MTSQDATQRRPRASRSARTRRRPSYRDSLRAIANLGTTVAVATADCDPILTLAGPHEDEALHSPARWAEPSAERARRSRRYWLCEVIRAPSGPQAGRQRKQPGVSSFGF